MKMHQAIKWAWDLEIEPMLKLTLQAIVFYYREGGKIFPSRRRLADMCGCSTDTIDRRIAALVRLGLVTKKSGTRVDGRSTSNVLTINFGCTQVAAPPAAKLCGSPLSIALRSSPAAELCGPKEKKEGRSHKENAEVQRASLAPDAHASRGDPTADASLWFQSSFFEGSCQGVDGDILASAFMAYDGIASQKGYQRIDFSDESQRGRLIGLRRQMALRILDIGNGDARIGLERFEDALSTIQHEPFLNGLARNDDYDGPFVLSLGALLSTSSKLGDVLARLLDLHGEHNGADFHPFMPAKTLSSGNVHTLARRVAR